MQYSLSLLRFDYNEFQGLFQDHVKSLDTSQWEGFSQSLFNNSKKFKNYCRKLLFGKLLYNWNINQIFIEYAQRCEEDGRQDKMLLPHHKDRTFSWSELSTKEQSSCPQKSKHQCPFSEKIMCSPEKPWYQGGLVS